AAPRLSRFEIQLITSEKVQANLLEILSESPVRSVRPQAASLPTYLQPSSL
ncbi:hypothetical protein Tco_0506918, partial [Tanacetum coccineum]